MKSYFSSCVASCDEQAETLIYESKAHLRVSVFARNPFLLFHTFTKAAPPVHEITYKIPPNGINFPRSFLR